MALYCALRFTAGHWWDVQDVPGRGAREGAHHAALPFLQPAPISSGGCPPNINGATSRSGHYRHKLPKITTTLMALGR